MRAIPTLVFMCSFYLTICMVVLMSLMPLASLLVAEHDVAGLASLHTLLWSDLLERAWHDSAYIVVFSFLVNINAHLFLVHVRANQFARSFRTPSLGGIAAVIGLGCAACGPSLFSALLGFGGGVFIATLPFGGVEIGYIGLVLLTLSAYRLKRVAQSPRVC